MIDLSSFMSTVQKYVFILRPKYSWFSHDVNFFQWNLSWIIATIRITKPLKFRHHQEVSRCCTRDESEESNACRWGSTQARDPLWNPEQTSPQVQTRGISGPTRTCSLEQFLKNIKADWNFMVLNRAWWTNFAKENLDAMLAFLSAVMYLV